jgi:hypothetical protein
MNDENELEIEMLSQPLLTEDGFVNPACMNELSAAIASIPATHVRLADDPEWSEKRWTFRKEIVGYFAMWACRQSPYGVPDGLENVCKYLYASLASAAKWIPSDSGMAELSLCEINRLLHEILMEKGVKEFDAWNVPKSGPTAELVFSSAFNTPDRDDDFIDLHALLHNVCVGIRDERRKHKAFYDKFEAEHGKLS